jgi:hypothetical protein
MPADGNYKVLTAGNQRTIRIARHSQRKWGETDRPDLLSNGVNLRPTQGTTTKLSLNSEKVGRITYSVGDECRVQACESMASLNLALNTDGWKGLTLTLRRFLPADRNEMNPETRPQHALHLVRAGGRVLSVVTGPNSCQFLNYCL